MQFLDLAFLHLIVELVERDAVGLGHRHFARLCFAIDDDLLGLGRIGHHLERVADFRQRFQTQHFDRHRRPDFADLLAAIVEHRAHACRTPSRR